VACLTIMVLAYACGLLPDPLKEVAEEEDQPYIKFDDKEESCVQAHAYMYMHAYVLSCSCMHVCVVCSCLLIHVSV